MNFLRLCFCPSNCNPSVQYMNLQVINVPYYDPVVQHVHKSYQCVAYEVSVSLIQQRKSFLSAVRFKSKGLKKNRRQTLGTLNLADKKNRVSLASNTRVPQGDDVKTPTKLGTGCTSCLHADSVQLLVHVVEVAVLQGLLRRYPLHRLVLEHFLQKSESHRFTTELSQNAIFN